MEEENRESLGGGIIAISVLHFIGAVISAITALGVLFFREVFNQVLSQSQIEGELGVPMLYIFNLLLVVILVVGLILILNRKVVGIYIYMVDMLY